MPPAIAIFMDISALSRRHLDTCLYSVHLCKTCQPTWDM